MSILQFPDEILLSIAKCLNQDSLIAMALMNRRLYNITAELLRSIKVSSFNQDHWNYIISSGDLLQELDFSECRMAPQRMSLAAIACSNLVQLNVLNTRLRYSTLCEILGQLKVLESLSFSTSNDVGLPDDFDERTDIGLFPSITKLYMEVCPILSPMGIIVDIVNRCQAVEWIHVNVIGMEAPFTYDSPLIPHRILPGRLTVLKTLVVCVFMSNTIRFHEILIFILLNKKMNRRFGSWIRETKECYIYENGFVNEEKFESAPPDANVHILKQVAHLHPTTAGRINDPTNAPWGSPRELRLNNHDCETKIDFILRDISSWSSTLVELDFSDCHNAVSNQERINFFMSFKSLKVLSVPYCFLAEAVNDPPPQEVEDAFARLEVKKLFIVGNPQRKCFRKMCSRRTWLCDMCDSRNLCQANFPSLNALEALEELTVDGVLVKSYHKIATPTARTVRLNLNCGTSLVNMNRFFWQSQRVRKFKFTIPDLDLDNVHLWNALAECERLKQLCLATYLPYLDGTLRMRRVLPVIVHGLESLHLHCPSGSAGDLVKELFSSAIFESYRGALVSSECPSMDALPLTDVPPSLMGRGLCYSGSGVGIVKPLGWGFS